MRSDRGHQKLHAPPPPLGGAAPAGLEGPAVVATPAALGARARGVLGQVQALERELLFHRTLPLDRIGAVTRALDQLQDAIAESAEGHDRTATLAELRGARRCVTDALVLTLDLLHRLRLAEAGG